MRRISKQGVQHVLLPLGIHAPSGLHGHILNCVDLEADRNTYDAGVCSLFPEDFSGPGVECAKVPVVGPSHEDHSSGRGQDRSPIVRLESLGPDLLSSIQVPGLQLADMSSAFMDRDADVGKLDPGKDLTRAVCCLLAREDRT